MAFFVSMKRYLFAPVSAKVVTGKLSPLYANWLSTLKPCPPNNLLRSNLKTISRIIMIIRKVQIKYKDRYLLPALFGKAIVSRFLVFLGYSNALADTCKLTHEGRWENIASIACF